MSPQEEAAQGTKGASPGADREMSEFLLRACHDLRAALRSVRAHAELLLRDRDTSRTAELKQRLGFIADGARRADLLADGLVSYAMALQTERRSFQFISMDVLLRNVLTRLDGELREAGASVWHEKLPPVTGDPDRLMQVFENLLRNAVRHRGPH